MRGNLTAEAEEVLHYLRAKRSEAGPRRITPEHPISGRELATKFGMKGGSVAARAVIHDIRAHGHWIGANSNGYFYALTWAEIRETVESLKGRARETVIPANAMLAKAQAGAKDDQLPLL